MSVLSAQTIRELCTAPKDMITPFDEDKLQGASFDLSAGDEYYLYREDHKDEVVISHLEANRIIIIPPNEVCFIMTEERVKIPKNIAGTVSLRFGLVNKGIMFAKQTQIDPGYNGKIVGMFYNLSNDTVKIAKGEHILSIEFRLLNEETDKPYDENHQNLDNLSEFISQPISSSLTYIRKQVDSLERSIYVRLTTILTCITIIIALLTLLFSALGFKALFWPSSPNNKPSEISRMQIGDEPAYEHGKGVSDDSFVVIDDTSHNKSEEAP